MIIKSQSGKLFNYDNVISVYKNGNAVYVVTIAGIDSLGEYSSIEDAEYVLKQFEATLQLQLTTFAFPAMDNVYKNTQKLR